jgi:hypothetical protein
MSKTAKEIASTIPCACSDCGMRESEAAKMIQEYADQQLAEFKEKISKNHLQWIYARMVAKHGENENYDYMLRFKEIIDSL